MEAEWLDRFPELRADPVAFGWEPYPLGEFRRLLAAAIPAAPPGAFLDAGCGVGTKCVAAADAGLPAEGVEVVPEYAGAAAELGVTVHVADLRGWGGFAGYAIVYLNCPLRDMGAEAALEAEVQAAMAPGAVLIQVNDCGAPAGWAVIVDERPAFRGVYVKPGG